MRKKKILIIEDEILIAEETKSMLLNLGYDFAGLALNLTDALELFEKTDFDIALVDLMLGNKKDGIEIARILKNKKKPYIITSSYSDKNTLDEIKLLLPSGYIIKPLQESDLYAAIEIIPFSQNDASFNFLDDGFFYKDKDLFIRIVFEEIHYIKSDRNYVEVFTSDKKHLLRIPLEDFINKLPGHFIRVHRSFIVNSKLITSVNSLYIKVAQEQIPLSKTYKDEVLKKLKIM